MNVKEVLGLTEIEAVAKVQAAGFVARVVEKNGEYFMVTQDIRTNRVNLSITEGVVTRAIIG